MTVIDLAPVEMVCNVTKVTVVATNPNNHPQVGAKTNSGQVVWGRS